MNLLIAVFTLPILLAFGCSNVKTEKSTPSKPSYSRIIVGELTSEKHLAAPSTVGIYYLEKNNYILFSIFIFKSKRNSSVSRVSITFSPPFLTAINPSFSSLSPTVRI